MNVLTIPTCRKWRYQSAGMILGLLSNTTELDSGSRILYRVIK
ncbi:MAG: hypothetical protein ACE5SW_09475 [Nitrososphaeraceae archaeon]